MTPEIAAILAVDGIANGAIYVLVAIGLVLIFTVTRVIFVPFGDIAAFAALTLAALNEKRLPGTAGLVLGLAALATLIEATSLARLGRWRALPRALGFYLALPALAVGAAALAVAHDLPMPLRVVLALLLVLPIAPLLDRIVFRPIADATVLLLLIVAVALHYALVGLGLLRPRRRPYGAVHRRFVQYRRRRRVRADRADRRRRDRLQRPALHLVRLHLDGQGAARHRRQSNRRQADGHKARAIGRDRLSLGFADGGRLRHSHRARQYDLLRFWIPDRPEGLRRRHHWRAGELSRRRDWRALRRHARKLRGFPEQRLQGRHRVFSADSRPALALDRLRPLRRRHRGMSAWPSKLAAVLAVVAILAAPTFVSAFTVTLLNYIGVYALVAIGLVLLTGIGGLVSFGQAAFVGLGAYSTAWLTTAGGRSPWLGLGLATAVTC